MFRYIGQIVAATTAFARASNPDDELAVVEFNDTRWVAASPVTASDPQSLEGRFSRASSWPATD